MMVSFNELTVTCRVSYMIILSVISDDIMATTERVTVTLPVDDLESIDRLEKNRSRFITEAVQRELARRRREGLLQSLGSQAPEAAELVDAGFAEWSAALPIEDEGVVDLSDGKVVRWVIGEGWVEEPT
jgi:hypothetical protein